MFADRQKRVRVLEALERTVKQFRTREAVWPLYVPRDPVSMHGVIGQAVEGASFDPLVLRARTLMWLAWPDGTTWELWVIALPSGLKLYCDSDGDETRLLATGRRDSEIDTDRLVLELLAESAGQHFGIGLEGEPPSRVRSPVDDREQLVDFFVTLFEVAGMEDDVRRGVTRSADFRTDVEAWLDRALTAKG
jgi:hypothetical protein